MDTDQDSTFGGSRDSGASFTISLLPELRELRAEHGRGYHAYHPGTYPFPSDEQEMERMDLEHALQMLYLGGRLHLCPITDPTEILDLGTGTGKWAIEMADFYPRASVIGIDLSPIQPEWIPPNCLFLVDDFECEGQLDSGRYDLIHARFLMGGVRNFTELYEKAYHALRPGGWIEITESTWDLLPAVPSHNNLSWAASWSSYLKEALQNMGKQCPGQDEFADFVRTAGFSRVRSVSYKRLIGPKQDHYDSTNDGNEMSEGARLNFVRGLEAWSLKPLVKGLGWSEQSVGDLVDLVQIELCQPGMSYWQTVTTCYAQKPLR